MKQETISIESPEKIRFEYKIARTGTRIGAYILDMVIQGMIILLGYLLLVFTGLLSGNRFSNGEGGQIGFMALAFFYLLIFFFQWGYFTFFEMFKNGQSPGKKAMRISVMNSNGDPPDAPAIVLRNLLRAVDGFPLFHMLAGLISILDKKSRRLGDIIAGTVVVHEIRFDLKEPAFSTELGSNNAGQPFTKPVAKLDEEELYVIRRFLNQRRMLPREKQVALAAKLAANVEVRLNITRVPGDDILFLEGIYREHSTEPGDGGMGDF